jgi:hypothetical protein
VGIFFNLWFLTSETCSLDFLRYCRTAAPQHVRTAGLYVLRNLLLPNIASPAIPNPKRRIVAGSGTAVTDEEKLAVIPAEFALILQVPGVLS